LIAFWLIVILAPLGSVLLPVLVIASLTVRFGPDARLILKRGALVGTVCGVVMALVFMLEPGLSMPGPGNYALMLAASMAGFAGTAVISLLRRSLFRST
jgi:hypothetical protein